MQVKQMIDSTHFEKNWIPIWNKPGAFLYQWHTDCYEVFELGVGRDKRVSHNFPLLSRSRGSTLFWPWTPELRLGVVHYSEGDGPRQYYHLLVVLRESDGAVLGHTAPFRFLGEFPVEFCIGFWPDWEGQQLHFWISQMDRNPAYLVADYEQFRFFTQTSKPA